VTTEEVLWVWLADLTHVLAIGVEGRELLVWHVGLVVATRTDTWVDGLGGVKAGVGLLKLDLTEGTITADLTDLILNNEDATSDLVLVQMRVGHRGWIHLCDLRL